MEKLIKAYQDFRGGWNADVAPDNLADNELMLADNVDLDERGAISKRRGTAPLSSYSDLCPLQEDRVWPEELLQDELFEYDESFVLADTALAECFIDYLFNMVQLASSASAVDDTYNGKLLAIVTGSGAGQTRTITDYDGVNRIARINMPWAVPPDGTSKCDIVTSYESQVERLIEWPRNDGSKVLLAIIGTTLCRIADDGTKTDLKVLDNASIGHFFFQDKFWFTGREGGTDKFWTYDGTNVTEVTPNTAGDNDLGPIKRCRLFVWHPKSLRIFTTKDANDRAALYYSETNDPTYFKSTSKIYPTTADGPTSGLTLFGDAVLVLYQGSIWSWTGADPAVNAAWEKLSVGQGTVSDRSVVLAPNALVFLGAGGLYALSPGILEYNVIMVTGEELIRNIAKNKVTSVIRNIANPETTCAVFDKYTEKYLLAYEDKVLVFDWDLKSFTRYTGFQVNDFCQRANGDLLIATNKYILKAGQDNYADWDTTTDSYKPIPLEVKTKQWNLDYPVHLKKIKKTFLAIRQQAAERSRLDIEIIVSHGKKKSITDIPLNESFAWGDIWGLSWGWEDLLTKEIRCNLKGQRVYVVLKNSVINQPITIYGIAFEYRVKRPKGVRVDG